MNSLYYAVTKLNKKKKKKKGKEKKRKEIPSCLPHLCISALNPSRK
jgi:hypothetical protein